MHNLLSRQTRHRRRLWTPISPNRWALGPVVAFVRMVFISGLNVNESAARPRCVAIWALNGLVLEPGAQAELLAQVEELQSALHPTAPPSRTPGTSSDNAFAGSAAAAATPAKAAGGQARAGRGGVADRAVLVDLSPSPMHPTPRTASLASGLPTTAGRAGSASAAALPSLPTGSALSSTSGPSSASSDSPSLIREPRKLLEVCNQHLVMPYLAVLVAYWRGARGARFALEVRVVR